MLVCEVYLHLQCLDIVVTDPLVTAPGSYLDHLLGVERDLGVEGLILENRDYLGVGQDTLSASTLSSMAYNAISVYKLAVEISKIGGTIPPVLNSHPVALQEGLESV